MTLQITRVDWHPEKALATAERLGRVALERGGERLLDSAGKRVPYRTGELAASARLKSDGDTVAVGYEAPHARFVHAHPEWHFGGGRSGRWLEETLADEADAVGQVITETFRSGWPGG